jgi:hypothetical protein
MEITNELLAAYAEGKVSESERDAVRQYLATHPEQLETVMIMMDEDLDIPLANWSNPFRSFDDELETLLDEIECEEPIRNTTSVSILPLMSKAAQNVEDHLCAVKCEGYALRALGIDVSDKELESEAEEEGWLKSDGTPLHCIGLLSERHGLFAARRYNCSFEDLIRAVTKRNYVIAIIDSTELNQTLAEAQRNDLENGEIPNHAVVIQSVDLKNKTVTIFDPASNISSSNYPIDIFQDAWDDSANYTVILSNQSNYDLM